MLRRRHKEANVSLRIRRYVGAVDSRIALKIQRLFEKPGVASVAGQATRTVTTHRTYRPICVDIPHAILMYLIEGPGEGEYTVGADTYAARTEPPGEVGQFII